MSFPRGISGSFLESISGGFDAAVCEKEFKGSVSDVAPVEVVCRPGAVGGSAIRNDGGLVAGFGWRRLLVAWPAWSIWSRDCACDCSRGLLEVTDSDAGCAANAASAAAAWAAAGE